MLPSGRRCSYLPPELWCHILAYIPDTCTLWACRQVSRTFKAEIDRILVLQCRVKEFTIYLDRCEFCPAICNVDKLWLQFDRFSTDGNRAYFKYYRKNHKMRFWEGDPEDLELWRYHWESQWARPYLCDPDDLEEGELPTPIYSFTKDHVTISDTEIPGIRAEDATTLEISFDWKGMFESFYQEERLIDQLISTISTTQEGYCVGRFALRDRIRNELRMNRIAKWYKEHHNHALDLEDRVQY